MTDEEIRSIRKIDIVACGSASHVGMTAKYVIESMAIMSGRSRCGK